MATDTRREAWRIEAGERESLTFAVQDADDVLFPIDGWLVAAAVRELSEATVLYTFPPENIVVDSDLNTIALVVPGPTSAAWTWTTGWYAVYISDPNSDPADPSIYRVLQGVVVVDPA